MSADIIQFVPKANPDRALQSDAFEILDPNTVIRNMLFGELDKTIDTAPCEMPPPDNLA